MEILKEIKIKLLNRDAKIPVKATDDSSGFDIFSCEDCILKKKSYKLISTGITIELEKGMEAQIRPRSGLAFKNGITVLNSPGTIDADYRGEVKIILINHSNIDFQIKKEMRIAQIVFSKILNINLIKAENINKTNRDCGGFGSTGL